MNTPVRMDLLGPDDDLLSLVGRRAYVGDDPAGSLLALSRQRWIIRSPLPSPNVGVGALGWVPSRRSLSWRRVPVSPRPCPTAVSYTHLDVYKRQATVTATEFVRTTDRYAVCPRGHTAYLRLWLVS